MPTEIVDQDFQEFVYQNSGPVGSSLTLDVPFYPSHWFAGIDFYTDAELTNKVTPSAGTLEITVLTVNSDNAQGITSGGTIDATSDNTVSDFQGNVSTITYAPTVAITGAAFMRIRATGNQS